MGKGRGVWGQGLMEYTPPFPVSSSVEGAWTPWGNLPVATSVGTAGGRMAGGSEPQA